ncbi:hypothetical protein ACFO0S_00150 [Chryseomicrobium palamuruense]|uniref:Uncharacterized protein n=1 Tax=Chryseomicrobium palamuruense TaxID=682973 RepID=A0ABV8USQ4_9BACL
MVHPLMLFASMVKRTSWAGIRTSWGDIRTSWAPQSVLRFIPAPVGLVFAPVETVFALACLPSPFFALSAHQFEEE